MGKIISRLLKFFSYKNNNYINYKVWLNIDDKNFIYPENNYSQIKEKLDIGLCLSGGGLRATTFSFGCLRSLYNLNVLKKIKYISANSGGSWILAPLSYMDKNIDLDIFFDKYIPPEKITLEKIKEINQDSFTNLLHSNLIIDDLIKNYCENTIFNDKYNIEDFWSKTMSEIFLKKYNLDKFDLVPSIDMTKLDMPYPIIVGTAYISKDIDIGNIEFTPLYYGICNKIKIDEKTTIGCNLIEPIGFTSIQKKDQDKNIKKINENIIEVNTLEPENVISIPKIMGISSSAISIIQKYINNKINDILDFSFINYYDYNSSNYFNNNLQLTDGALFDNNALLSQIRRNIKKIIIINTFNFNSENISTDVFKSNLGNNLAGFFGVGTFDDTYFGYTIEEYNKYRKIFDKEKWNDIIELYKKNKNLINIKLEVFENKYNGVRGNYEVELLIIFLEKDDWIDKLPEETKNYINNNSNDKIENILETLNIKEVEFNNFPHISAQKLNYSKELVNSITQLGSYIIDKNKDIINKFINT